MSKITAVLLAALLCPAFAGASERHFIYSYESGVLPPGDKELESYTTFKFGRSLYYSALDQWLEFELGLGSGVQTSLYLNYEQEMADDGTGAIGTSFMSDGISNEWKFRLKDVLTDSFGLGLYAEAGFKPDEFELETKVILDKKEGNWLGTVNLTFEPEYDFPDNSFAFSLVPSLGLGYFLVSDRLFLGLEAQNDNFYGGQPLQSVRSIFSAGPVLSYTAQDWWITLTALPQWASLNGPGLDLATSQRMQVRLAASLSLNSTPPKNQETLPVPAEEDAERLSGEQKIRLADLKSGRDLYVQNCVACHRLAQPSEYTGEGWEKIMLKMKDKAGIGEETANLILGYVKAFSRDSAK